MNYITTTRTRINSLSGEINLPAKTPITELNGFYYYDNKRLCATRSFAARGHFSRNDDGKGMRRGALCRAIENKLQLQPGETPAHRSERWEVVWDDEICQKYKKASQADFWLWDMEFYHAPIEDLKHIAKLVGAKGVK